MTNYTKLIHIIPLLVVTAMTTNLVRADLVLETETAYLGKKGEGTFGNAVQFERDKDGLTILTLTALEYAPTDDVEILFEPFFYEEQHPKGGPVVSGQGDTELTFSYRIVDEGKIMPAVVLAAKVKLPTATNAEIGTRRADYTGYLILGKTIDGWEFNANAAVETFGSPAGSDFKNQFIYDFSVTHSISEKWTGYAEVFGNTSPEAGVRGTFSGAVGAEYQLSEHVNSFVSLGLDTDHLTVVRMGVNYTW
jgi:hypothetical protein